MEDTEANDVSIETLKEQFDTVVEKTDRSPVMKFGDFTFMSEAIGDFEGTTESEMSIKDTIFHHATHLYKKAIAEKTESKNLVSSRNHDMYVLYEEVMRTGSTESMHALEKELQHREFVDSLFIQFEDSANAPEQPQDYDCLRLMVGSVEELCGPWSAYSLQYVAKLSNACDSKTVDELALMNGKIASFCGAY